MKKNRFEFVVILSFSILLSSCGGGSSASVDRVTPSPEVDDEADSKEVLPFDLQDSTGLIAIAASTRSLAMGGWHGTLMHFANAQTQVSPEEESTEADYILIEKFIEPRCKTGSILYTDNAPPVPVRASTDLGEWPGLIEYDVQASNCNLVEGLSQNDGGFVEGSYTFADYVDGSLVGESYISNDADSRAVRSEANYTKFAFGGWDEKKKVFNVTGSSSSSLITNDGESKLVIDVPSEEYEQESTGHKLVVTNLHNDSKKSADGSAVTKQYGYTVKWNVRTKTLGQQVDYRVDGLVGLASSSKVFPLGDYELTYTVTEPLVETSREHGLYWPYDSGSIMISLTSHNISAEVTYFKDYAIVIYNRGGSIEQVRINAKI